MKIAIVAWGYIPKPPLSNSIYTLINEYKFFLDKLGYEVDIINEESPDEAVEHLNNSNYDFVHLHAYNFVDTFNRKLKQKYCFTCHYGYLLKEDKWDEEFHQIFKSYMDTPGIIALSYLSKDLFLKSNIQDL